MAIITTTGVKVTLDETSGLQNDLNSNAVGDFDDNDILHSLPAAFSGRMAVVLAATTPTETVIGAALSGYNGSNTGLNAFTIAPNGGGTITDVRFTDSSGDLLNGLDSGHKTAGGVKIYLYNDTADNNILLGRAAATNGSADPSGAIVFAAYIEETGSPVTGGKIWSTLYQPLYHDNPANPDDSIDLDGLVRIGTSQDTQFSLANAPSGQNLFLMFTTAVPTVIAGRVEGVSIIATGKNPADQSSGANITTGDTINTSQAGGPTTFGTNNQMITEQEGIRFTFVTGAKQDFTISNLNQTEADIEANIDFTAVFGARTATFDIVQLQSGKSAQVKISAFNTAAEPGVNFINGYTNDSTVAITNVRVINIATGQVIENSNGSVNSPNVAITVASGVATITGVLAGHKVEYTTTGDHNRVLIENGAALDAKGNDHADFDIGGFKLLQVSTGTVPIGTQIVFEDDGPSITVSTVGTADALMVDETDLATNASANFADNFGHAPNYGADGAGTVSSAYALSVKTAGVDSGLVDVASNEAVMLTLNGAGVVEGRTASGNALVFTVSVSAAGLVSLDQLRALTHPNAANPDDAVSPGAADLIRLTRTDTITDKDGDTSSGFAAIDIAAALSFEDDGPAVSANLAVKLDDDALLGGNAGGTGDDVDAENISGTLGHSFGADGAGSIAYLTSSAPTGFSYEAGAGNSLLVKQGTATVLTLTLNVSTGAYAVTQNAPILHAAGLDENNQAFTINYQVTDGDGDTAHGSLGIDVDDDTPNILKKTDLVYANSSNPTPGGTGIFDYAIGADARLTFSSSNSDFSAITLAGTVGSTAISSPAVTWFSEDVNTAVFNVQFNYRPDPASTATTAATGTLTFDKVNDTYTVALAQPIAGFTTLTTGQALSFTGYTLGTNTIDQTQPDVSVARLSSDFFVQFTGYSEPGGGTGANNLQGVGSDLGTNFVNGELFTQAVTWVSVSNAANGVAGDTIQKGEVLDLDFFNTNPTGFTGLTPTTQASGVFLKFDGINSEDLVLILKLVDPDDQSRTTKAIVIDNSDIIKFGGTIPTGYSIALDNNDGAAIIESNDFNTGSQNYLIEGAQLLVSTEGVTGTAINLNAATGASGASTTFQEFDGTPGIANPEATTTDSDVIKISDIGFVTANSATLNTKLNFDLSIVDADGDVTGSQTLGVSIVGGASLSPTSGADTFAFTDADTDGLLAAVMYNVGGGFATSTDKLDFSTAGSGTNYAEMLVPQTNLSVFVAAADIVLDGTVDYYFGVVGGNGYLATDADGLGITSIVQLAGVTDMTAANIV